MSTAKTLLLNELNEMPDEIDDEFQIIENLYKVLKLKKSQQSVEQYGALSTEQVREHFSNERRA
ncbi:MAG: hypothetical protein GX567_16610 [Clostridia bacterium]|nr:hypothetical protein [Clostridia bacterium]